MTVMQKQKEILALSAHLVYWEREDVELMQCIAYTLEEIDSLIQDNPLSDPGVEHILLDVLCEYRRRQISTSKIIKDIKLKLESLQKELEASTSDAS